MRIRDANSVKIKVCLLFTASLLIASCTTKLLYNYADWALEWYVDDLVTLNDDQEWKLKDAIASTIEWHRKNQIPLYIQTLDELEDAVDDELTISFLKRFYFAHEKGWMELKYHITPTLAGLLKTLSTSQVDELEENMLEQEQELREKYVEKNQEELTKERTERMIDRVEDWIGNPGDKQQQIIVNWSHQVKKVADQWAYSRQQWQSSFIRIVRESRKTPEFNALIMEHFQNSRKYWPQGYEAAYYYNVDLTLKMFVDISKEMTNEQKNEFLKKISNLKKQFTEIYKGE